MTRVPGIELHVGDITRLDVTAIANAANEALAPGGGVCGAIFRAAGPELAGECRALGGCPTGECRLTQGHGLKASWILHCVGPVWHGSGRGEAALLASCYRSALEIAAQRHFESVAFPAISTGIFGYPPADAARIAVGAVHDHLAAHDWPKRVILVAYDEGAARPLRAALAAAMQGG